MTDPAHADQAPSDTPRPVEPPPADEIAAAAEHVVAAAIKAGLRVRLMGGLAVRLTSPSAMRPPFARDYRDFDLVAHGKDVAALRRLLEAEGYVGDRLFNAIHGASRLIYSAPDGRWATDIVIDRLAMSHVIELRDRLSTDGLTIDLADLLLTKLQIWETNAKDLGDAACLMLDHRLEAVGRLTSAPAADGTPAPIDLRRLQGLLGSDWGLCHTAERNLRAIIETTTATATGGEDGPERAVASEVVARATTLLAAIDVAPKSLGWRTRARVGERMPWYERPEEARR